MSSHSGTDETGRENKERFLSRARRFKGEDYVK
jgi:hypothetical protein